LKDYRLIRCTCLAGPIALYLARSCADTDTDTPDSFSCAVAQLVGHFGIHCLATCLDFNTTASIGPPFFSKKNQFEYDNDEPSCVALVGM
jgi:hypothetical protein